MGPQAPSPPATQFAGEAPGPRDLTPCPGHSLLLTLYPKQRAAEAGSEMPTRSPGIPSKCQASCDAMPFAGHCHGMTVCAACLCKALPHCVPRKTRAQMFVAMAGNARTVRPPGNTVRQEERDPATPLLHIYPTGPKARSHAKICAQMFIAVLLEIAKSWKQPRSPATWARINGDGMPLGRQERTEKE